eukprot:Cvel_4102.t1-p1 / transcript=Cvel_4102.t1 / gene=Cvel_4102 / organism=Chromera_velia_CCMP2878 / gene_product=Bis(5'-nucleosyl)-tetraphosphatase PrpE, putative / transcript_product=Bis(5'-nucleosyl)-tetraphosphatase PrpE, putative / location=Cvel_scaffold175:562-1554(-) / protein_length=331 / sequence_SO=supercontig / SO=protein_coding / is_pseudo=false
MLVQRLFEGPVDLIGDVHGECGALLELLDRLGYDADGQHPDQRCLVFVGDLVDRGPDSPGVVRLVRHLVSRGTAQCILGNHELNVLLNLRKHGNAWFFGEPESLCKGMDRKSCQVMYGGDEERRECLAFLASLPLALERPDLRVVHAQWHEESVQQLRELGDAVKAYAHFKRQIEEAGIEDTVEKELAFQNHNPVKVATSGTEERAPEVYFGGGKMRRLQRCCWWEKLEQANGMKPESNGSHQKPLTVIGHYWRRLPEVPDELARLQLTGPSMFGHSGSFSLLPNRVMCIDYSVGLRYEERGRGILSGQLGTGLGALRFPEMEILFENGRQ